VLSAGASRTLVFFEVVTPPPPAFSTGLGTGYGRVTLCIDNVIYGEAMPRALRIRKARETRQFERPACENKGFKGYISLRKNYFPYVSTLHCMKARWFYTASTCTLQISARHSVSTYVFLRGDETEYTTPCSHSANYEEYHLLGCDAV
jgi:hypothetical protein